MATHFEPGRYLVRAENQRFIESSQKATLGLCLDFRIVKIDDPDDCNKCGGHISKADPRD